MKLTKSGRPDKRFKSSKTFEARDYIFWKKYGNLVAVAIMGFFAGVILSKTLWDIKHPKIDLSRPLSQTIEVKTVNAQEREFCNDIVNCIRDVGEELGVKNQDIMTMVRISKCESGHREDATGVNKNKTIDRGVFQLNSVHKGISNKDAYTYELNIRYAYRLFLKQGTTPWNSSKRCWNQ